MGRPIAHTAVLLALVALGSAAVASTVPDAALEGVVRIMAREGGDNSFGSGVVVLTTPDTAYIVSVTHVTWVRGRPEGAYASSASSVEVEFRPLHNRRFGATVMYREEDENGLALLAVPIGGELVRAIAALPLAPTYDVKPLDELQLVGDAARSGPWSVVARRAKSVLGRDLIIDGTTEAGFSGGPVLKDSRVVGMVARGDAADTVAISAASIWNFARNLLPSGALESASVESEPEFARARRRLMEWGVECTDVRFLESVVGGQADVVRLFLIANPGYAHLRFDPALLERGPQPTAEDAARAAAEAAADAERGLRTVEPTKWSPLMVAVLHDQGEVVRELLRAGADASERTGSATPLVIAAAAGNARAVRALIEGATSGGSSELEGDDALSMAVQYGDDPSVDFWEAGLNFDGVPRARYSSVVRELLRPGLRLISDPARADALATAAGSGDATMVTTLLECGAMPDPDGHALAAAVLAGDRGVLDAVMARAGGPAALRHIANSTVTATGPYALGQRKEATLLSSIVRAGDEKLVKLLLDAGAQPDAMALGAAIVGKSVKIVQMLLDRGADANGAYLYGPSHGRDRPASMLQLAAMCGNTDIAGLLLGKGARVDASLRDRYPQSDDLPPLGLAVVQRDSRMVGLLLQNGARPDTTVLAKAPDGSPMERRMNYSGLHLLHVAVMGKDQDTAGLLIAHGADVNVRCMRNATYWQYSFSADPEGGLTPKGGVVDDPIVAAGAGASGWTPLHIAVEAGDLLITMALLQAGADVNAQTEGGWTPLDQAMYYRQKEIAAFLRGRGGVNHYTFR